MPDIVTVSPTTSNAWAVITTSEPQPQIFSTRSEAIQYAQIRASRTRPSMLRILQSEELNCATPQTTFHR